MSEWIQEREWRLREFFGLGRDVHLLNRDVEAVDPPPATADRLSRFNIEWHIIPSADAVRFDEGYVDRLYPMRSRDFSFVTHTRTKSYMQTLSEGHSRHQGLIIGVETTRKPRYLPGNRQFYGTAYGFDPTADPFAGYLGRAGFLTGTRYAHDYASLREFVDVVTGDWRARDLLPKGYRLTVCPPAIFNLVGAIFHPEWSETETLELGFYRDAHGNATCYAVGSNEPGDSSYIHELEADSDWTLLGFRVALVPE